MKKTIFSLLISTTLNAPVLADEYTDAFFSALDTDKDAQLSLQELRGSGANNVGDACSQQLLMAMDAEIVKLFEQLDGDQGRKISKAELIGSGNRFYEEYMKSQFTQADVNEDNQVSRAEYKHSVKAEVAKFNEAYSEEKLPDACRGDLEQWNSHYQGFQDYAVSFFGYLDKNGDGKLTYAEYKGDHLWN